MFSALIFESQSFIRVQGLNGEWVSVNIAGAVDGSQIRDTIYAAFNITDDRNKEDFVIFRKEISSAGSRKSPHGTLYVT